jgi:hypothetical protein
MWTINQLRSKDIPMAKINDKWVPARPLNYQKKYISFWKRLKRAWTVFTCEADAFTWPEKK